MRGPMRIGATATAAALVLCLLLLRAAGADARNATGGLASPHVLFASIAFPNHLIPLARLAFEMRRRGYRVSFATNTPGRRWLRGLDAEILDLGPFPVPWRELAARLEDISRDTSSFRGILTLLNEVYLPFSVPTYTALLPFVARDPPDVMVVDVTTLGAHDVALRTGIPAVMNNPSVEFSVDGPPSYIPAWGTGFGTAMTLWERCINLLYPRLLSVALTPPFMHLNKVRWERRIPPHRSQHDLFLHMRVLMNSAVGVDYARPLTPLTTYVGPIVRPGAERAPLPAVTRRWLDAGPAIFVTFGPLVQPSTALLQELVKGASAGGRRALWSLPPSQSARLGPLPATTRVTRQPQEDVSPLPILAHRNVHAIVCECAMGAAQEALYAGVPVLCIPFYADHSDVGARIVDTGAAIALAKDRVTASAVDAAIRMITLNATYPAAAKRVRTLLRSAGGVRKAADVVESTHAIGHAHLVTPTMELPWHRTVVLDVLAVHLAALVMLTAVAYLLYAAMCAAAQAVGSVFAPQAAAHGKEQPEVQQS